MSIQFPANPPLNDTFDYDGKTYIWDGEKWTASAIGSFDEAYVNISGDTMTGDLTVPSLNGGPLAGMRNQLINGDFRVWQRGNGPFTSATADQFYTADRWALGADGTRNGTVTKLTDHTNIPAGFSYAVQVSANAPALTQKIELLENKMAPFAVGQTWTVSLWSSVDLAGSTPFLGFLNNTGGNIRTDVGSNFVNTGKPASNGYEHYSSQITIAAEPNGVGTNLGSAVLGIRSHRDDALNTEISYTGIQLEPGPVATLFEMRTIGTELALCQRYFIRKPIFYREVGAIPGYRSSGGSGITVFTIPYLDFTNMRTLPTVESEAGGTINVVASLNTNSSTKYNFECSLLARGSGDCGYVRAAAGYSPASGTYDGTPGYINNNAGSYIDLDAEL